MIQIIGEVPEFRRIQTGWFSFDHALADQTDIGYPVGQMAEVYGPNGVGKTTFIHSLAFTIAKQLNGDIASADFEGLNRKLMISNSKLQGFDGKFYNIQDKDDEVVLKQLVMSMRDKEQNYMVGIIDTLGSFSPKAELSEKSNLGDSNMGIRARIIGQFCRRMGHLLLNNPEKNLFMLNHQHPRIGSLGFVTPGGEQKGYSSSIRLEIRRLYEKTGKVVFKDGSYVLAGNVVKNRWGLEGRKFYLFVLSGKGVHTGLTAMYDALKLKKATVSRNVISLDGTSFGNIHKIIEVAQEGDDAFFQPFVDVLKGAELPTEDDEEDEKVEE